MGDRKLLKKLEKQMEALQKTTAQNQVNLQQTVHDQLTKQTQQTLRMENKIDHLQRTNLPSPPPLNEDRLIQKVAKILDKNNKSKNNDIPKEKQKQKTSTKQSEDPYIDFINGCFDRFDPNKTDKIALDTMPKVLELLDITGNKKSVLMLGFNDICKLTEPQIYRHQYLSALLNMKGKEAPNKALNTTNVSNMRYISNNKNIPPPPPPPIRGNRMRSNTFKGHKKTINAKQPAVIVLPEGKDFNDSILNQEEIDFKNNNNKATAPKLAELLNDKQSVHAWAMRKGDTFFKTNKKRYIIVCGHGFYWSMSDIAEYPNGGLNLHGHHVHVTQHATTLRVKSSQKERIFNFGDIHTANKLYNKIIQIQNNHNYKNGKDAVDETNPFQKTNTTMS